MVPPLRDLAEPAPTAEAPVVTSERQRVRGLACMVVSCALFAAMSSLVYAVQLREPDASVLVSSFARIVVNLVLLVGVGAVTGDWHDLLGDRRPSLWWRGVFGSLALLTSFTAIRAIGVGEASFLSASNGVFVAMLAPLFLKQPNSPRVWVAIGGAVVGLFLLFEPRLGDVLPTGRALAVASGGFSAMAYMMIARAGRSNSPNSVIFYFCIVCTTLHLVLFAVLRPAWPVQPSTYVMLGVAGLLGSVAQLFLTLAYQTAPAAMNSAVSYLQPVLNMGLGILLFDKHPDAKALVGAAIVLTFGVALPFVRLRRSAAAAPRP
jgi:S-adenosylmethionine uptake transporter